MKSPFTPAASSCRTSGRSLHVASRAMREAIVRLRRQSRTRVNPLDPAELVIDHSVRSDEYGAADCSKHNNEIESSATANDICSCAGVKRLSATSRVVPAQHRVCLKSTFTAMARVIFRTTPPGKKVAYPDIWRDDSNTHHGQQSGVLGWGGGRNRSRKRPMGPAGDDAYSKSIGFQAHRGACGAGHHGERHRVESHRDASQERRRGPVRDSSATVSRDCRSPTGDHRQTCRRSSARPAPSPHRRGKHPATSS